MKMLWLWIAVLGAFGLAVTDGSSGAFVAPRAAAGNSRAMKLVNPAAEGFVPRRSDLLEELEQQASHQDAAKRRRAVRDLAQLGGRDAWELVIRGLSDEKGEVADEAQFWLPGVDDERLIADLLGRTGLGSKDELVQLRVAEAFGRFAREFDGDELLGKVNRRHAAVAEMLLWSVERLALAGRLGGRADRCVRQLEKLVKAKGPGSLRAQAACTLSAVAPQRAGELLGKWLGDKAPEMRRAALLCAVGLGHEEAAAMGARLQADAVPFVRLAALDAIASGANKRAMELLVARMQEDPRYRLKVASLEHLQQLSGRKTKFNARAWTGWVQGLPDDWKASSRPHAPAEVGGTVSFAGLPILSDRICFLIDFSGSLWYEREGRPARKGKVDELVRAALPRLPAGTQFNIMPYTGEPHPWRDQLVDASPRQVKRAIYDFEANRERGSGNVFDAILLALQDSATDRLVILTDGAPTGGARWKLELMVPLLVQATRFNGVAIDSLVIDARPGLRKHWFELSKRTAGRARAVEL